MNAEQMAGKLVAWIKDRVEVAGGRGVVIGMSGGLDSSVMAALCQRACPQSTLGVLMPCHSDPEDKAHAQAVADKLAIPTVEVVLDDIYNTLLDRLPDCRTDPARKQLAQANLKPRARMLTLYYIANQLGYLVVGSGNRSEVAIGYFTKHGDGGVDIMPLGNLVKTQVKELASHLDIPQAVIAKPPSAGLWQGQTDEAEMGFTYQELDRYLLTGEAPDGTREKIEDKIASSAHKRALPPIPDL
jgi:NAD+ synthase